MNTLKNCLAAFALMLGTLAASQTATPTRQGVKIDNAGQGFCTEVMFYSPSIVRIVKYPCPPPVIDKPGLESLSVIMKPESTKFSLKEQEGRVVLASSEVTVTVDKQTGTLRFADRQGRSLLVEQGKPFFKLHQGDADEGDYQVAQTFKLDTDEAIYGLGQLQTGKMSQRNQQKYLIQSNLEDVVTFFQSVKGYGLYWDNYSPTTFTDNAEGTTFDSEVGERVDYYFLYGGNADGVVARMRTLTGQVPMFPLWTYGYWQSKETLQESG